MNKLWILTDICEFMFYFRHFYIISMHIKQKRVYSVKMSIYKSLNFPVLSFSLFFQLNIEEGSKKGKIWERKGIIRT